jgi:uncharacterized protein
MSGRRPISFLADGQTVIDGIGMMSLVNHSCEPNCKPMEQDQRIYLFARRVIAAGEELTFDYNLTNSNEREMLCHCDSRKCPGTMYSKEEMRRRKTRAQPSGLPRSKKSRSSG